MKLVHNESGLCIEFKENEIQVIIIENPKTYEGFVSEIRKQVAGEEGGFVYSDDNILNMSKCVEFVIDPWSIDADSKKIKNSLYQLINEEALDNLYDDFLETRRVIQQYMENLLDRMPYSMDYNGDIGIPDLVKVVDVHIDSEANSFAEKIAEYMKLVADICQIKLLVFCNLKSYLSDDELIALYQEANYKKINILMLESHMRTPLTNEKTTIIDKDNCIISI